VTGNVRKYFNEFITMPKGRIVIEVVGKSQFHIDPQLAQKTAVVVDEDSVPELGSEIVFQFRKRVDHEGDFLLYRLNEKQLLKEKGQPLNFDTFFYDDYLDCRVFIKNSTAKAHQIGKVKMNFRDFVFHDASLVHPCTFVNKATGFEAGTAFIRLSYEPLKPLTLLNPNW
jgi:hypothetical protein